MLKKISVIACITVLYASHVYSSAGPTAVFDSFEVCKDSTCNSLDVLSNDLAGCNKNLKVVATTQPSHGTSGAGCTVVWYAPSQGFTGLDVFSYTVEDGLGFQDIGTVLINVIDQSPNAVYDHFEICASSGKYFLDVLKNDLSSCDANIQIVSVSQTASSSVEIANDLLCYTPDDTFEGIDVFTYTIENGKGAPSTATVSVLVTSSAGPTAIDDSFEVCATSEASDNILFVLDNDMTGCDSNIKIISSSGSLHGTVSILAEGLALSYTPTDPEFEGTDCFEYTIEDDTGKQSSAYVIINLSKCKAGPTAIQNRFKICSGSTSNILYVLANDVAGCNLCNNELTICAVTAPSNGSATIIAQGQGIDYVPDPGFNGVDSFKYTIKDGAGKQSSAMVILEVT